MWPLARQIMKHVSDEAFEKKRFFLFPISKALILNSTTVCDGRIISLNDCYYETNFIEKPFWLVL